MMLKIIVNEFKNLWFGNPGPKIDNVEFERIESKHTRVQFDTDLNEIIRVR
ncbi:hypothetical protein IM538_08030 [Cytobacillus suaedae]|nr:hypothetical protein IM538_08030 [Cytobacillus suaedae]